ncbi:MAG: M36 family metallopeptidase [Sphingobacteriales bacterium]|nr:M36 family metallopeptidase [Sphingobacteriales bacterium]
MKKLLLFFLAAFSFLTIRAQVSDAEATLARQLVSKNAATIGISAEDINNTVLSSTYQTAEGIRLVYLYQSYRGIPVYNQMHVLAFKDEKLVSNAGGRIKAFDKLVNNPAGIPSLPAGEAVLSAISDAHIPASKIVGPVNSPVTNPLGKLDFGKLGVASENITAELFWYPVNEKDFRLVWQVFLAPDNSSDMLSVKVDAANGTVLGKDNYTVYCNWHKDDQSAANCNTLSHKFNYYDKGVAEINKFQIQKLPVVVSATYRVVRYPAESPQHPGGAPTLHIDPWVMAPGNATSLKWHNDGTLEHDSTRGNNVWAAEDRNATNSVIDKAAVSQTPQPNLTFDYVPDFAAIPTATTPPNQQFNITNLFYMNNIMHDVLYLYGFDEVSGNFQNDNQGRGGLGSDYVIGDAQDGGGTNNANFSTPVDGTRPRMQMYIWTAANPDRDGDADNGIVAHEFAHGISNRLTGGPANSSCLGNAEQAGEGWSDYYALMVTTDWSTATVNDGPLPRPIGTYALGQPTTGSGIRVFPYSTNLAVNPRVYQAVLPSTPHDRGEFWCVALWEITWAMIQQNGINPNLFNPAGIGGNSAAFKLVTEAMKLQPCSPGFIDGRNAILKADTLFFGGQYSCAIWTAFAKRGMGRGASQGSSSSVSDQIPSFVVSSGTTTLNENLQSQQENFNVTYTNKVVVDNCGAINNYFVTDTLPTNVTYVSGGTYNAGNRTVSFGPINLGAGAVQTYPFTVQINPGTYFAPVTHFSEPVASASIPASWTTSSINATQWTVSTTVSHTPPNSFAALYNPDLGPGLGNDLRIATTSQFTINPNSVSNYTTLTFWHRYNTEEGWDGGVVEISTNNGGNWTDLGPYFIKNGYNGGMGTGSNNPIGGRSAFTGTTAAFIESSINLSSYAGQSVLIRFRFASDDNTGPPTGTPGWWVDDIVLYSEPAVLMRSNLFNGSNVRQSYSDTITRITVGCAVASIVTPPANTNGCIGGSATFSVSTNGTNIVYQWQVNTGSGFADITNAPPYSGANTNTLTITNITAGMNGYLYRCIVGNSCTPSITSNQASLSVGAVATLNSGPANSNVCPGVNVNFSVNATNAAGYQWQVNTGSGFTDLTNVAPYSGVTTATMTITGTTVSMNNYQFRCVIGSCPTPLTSNAATLVVNTPLSITGQTGNTTTCESDPTTLSVTVTGTVTGYQWQVSTDGGANYSNISGATSSTFSIASTPTSLNNNRYRCVISGACGNLTSVALLLTVIPLPTFTLGAIPSTVCLSDSIIILTASAPGGVWSGPGVTGNSFNPAIAGLGSKTVTYTVNNGTCSRSQSATIQVNDCPERHRILTDPLAVFIYPNPNSGAFSIRMNSDLYKNLGVKVYGSDGKLLRTYFFNGLSFGTVIPMNLTVLPNGVYHLYLYNEEHGFIKRGQSIVIQRN